MNYTQRIPELRTPIKGLYLANTTQIYPEDRGTNYSVRLVKRWWKPCCRISAGDRGPFTRPTGSAGRGVAPPFDIRGKDTSRLLKNSRRNCPEKGVTEIK